MTEEQLIDTYRPGEKESVDDVIVKLKERQPSRLRLCAITGLSPSETMALGEAIPKGITELRLSNCQHSFVVSALEKLKETPVKKLHLFSIKIDEKIMKIIGDLLEMDQGLKELNMKENTIESDCVCLIAKGLRLHSTLKILDLSDSLIDSVGRNIILDAMKKNRSVEVLNLAGKVTRSSISSKSLGLMFKYNKTLQELDLCRNILQNNEAVEMADALCNRNRSLKVLRLANTGLNLSAAIAIGKMLEKNNSLEILDLAGNQEIGYAGVTAIAKGTRYLHHLDLRNTRLGVAGSTAVGNMLRKNNTLKSLNLSRNNIGNEGVANITDGIICNTVLKTLSLSMCNITRPGAIFIGHKLPAMKGMKQLFLYQNSIDEGGSEALLEGLKNNMILVDLGVEKRYLPSSDEVSLYLKLNRIGRRLLREPDIQDSIWPYIFSRAQTPDMINYFLRQRPDLCHS